ncbi:MAG TPA: deoxyribonuclease IV [Anaerolineae bacterium]|jgi:deoxyribonuclease-4|nr:deoxyribonuclease IV [Anaerolineae bacterium]
MRFGLHVSIAGSLPLAVERAQKRFCDTIQIFAGNPRSWERWNPPKDEVEQFRAACEEHSISPVIVHAPYLVNLAAPDKAVFARSKSAVVNGLKVCAMIGARYYVIHAGSSGTSSSVEGIEKVGSALADILSADDSGVSLLVENMSGHGSSIGVSFNQLSDIITVADGSERLGVCIDTCHAFAAGYDLSGQGGVDRTLLELDSIVGLERVRLIHANDSKFPLGSTRDRHEDIGAGYIGIDGFSTLVNHRLIANRPVILETPRLTVADDLRNLSVIRGLYDSPA